MKSNIFEDLFVLELANNHWGDVERGKKIITDFSRIVRFNNIKAAVKLQFRDVDHFIHKDFKDRDDIRYIKKTLATKMSYDDYGLLVEAIRKAGCITMSTPFDEKSVDTCVNLGIQIIKIASSDINDWILIEKIATTRKPVIVSTGGSSLKDIDDLVTFFENRNIPLAINHCVSKYPSEKYELELNQIDFLKNRYPNHVIGFSTHEGNEDIESGMLIAYAKGARTFERHIDIDWGGKTVSPYCSEPKDLDRWIKAYKKAREMCGAPAGHRRVCDAKEIEYLDALVRGVYAKRDLKKGEVLTEDDIYLAIPLQKGQISCREFMNGEALLNDISKDAPMKIDDIDSPYAYDEKLKNMIYLRGL
ncbi:MAG: N-acetylneuraminate synthase family protein [Clostridium sp.]|nr:N-acetylneuraminate synthase family protein [Clostridium sp.]